MKSIATQSLILAIMVATVSCKSSKKNKNPNTNVVEEVKPTLEIQNPAVEVTYADPEQQKKHLQTPEKADTRVSEQESAYALSVSFFSIGEGTDGAMMTKFKGLIQKYNEDKNVELVYETNSWGREGEVDFCFMLTELDQKGRADFIDKSMKMLAESKLVHVAENAKCHPKRR